MRDALCVGAALVVLLLAPPVAWAHSPEGGIRQCAAISNDGDRLRCFDALAAETEGGGAVSDQPQPSMEPEQLAESAPAPTVEPAPAVAVAPAAASTKLEPVSDDFGSERIRDENDRAEPEQYAARVTRCEESKQSGQYYFYFENGQVWKQANYQRLRWRNCEFDVSIAKGKLGYDMYIPEKDRSVRVARIR